MRKFLYVLFYMLFHLSANAENMDLGIFVDEIAIKRDSSLDYKKLFDCKMLQNVTLYQDMDEGEGESWEESLYSNKDMSILFYSPLKNTNGDIHPDFGKSFPIRFNFNSSKYRISINGKMLYVGMSQENLFSIFPQLLTYHEAYNKDHSSPFTVYYYVDYRLFYQYEFDDLVSPIEFVLNKGVVDSISIDTRSNDELTGWVEFDCCIKKIK